MPSASTAMREPEPAHAAGDLAGRPTRRRRAPTTRPDAAAVVDQPPWARPTSRRCRRLRRRTPVALAGGRDGLRRPLGRRLRRDLHVLALLVYRVTRSRVRRRASSGDRGRPIGPACERRSRDRRPSRPSRSRPARSSRVRRRPARGPGDVHGAVLGDGDRRAVAVVRSSGRAPGSLDRSERDRRRPGRQLGFDLCDRAPLPHALARAPSRAWTRARRRGRRTGGDGDLALLQLRREPEVGRRTEARRRQGRRRCPAPRRRSHRPRTGRNDRPHRSSTGGVELEHAGDAQQRERDGCDQGSASACRRGY